MALHARFQSTSTKRPSSWPQRFRIAAQTLALSLLIFVPAAVHATNTCNEAYFINPHQEPDGCAYATATQYSCGWDNIDFSSSACGLFDCKVAAITGNWNYPQVSGCAFSGGDSCNGIYQISHCGCSFTVYSGCASCLNPSKYGPACTQTCACNHGVCDAGPTGSGNCTCPGWATDGAGNKCAICAPGYYGPSCTACRACNSTGHGTCNDGLAGNGTCSCLSGFSSVSNCTECSVGRYGPQCVGSCPVTPSAACVHGICNSGRLGDGTCVCQSGWTGSACDACLPGYYGPSCTPCPSCHGHGSCRDTLAGDGGCDCLPRFDNTTDCTACEPGTFLGSSGLYCVPCPAGTASAAATLDDSSCCVPCRAGTHAAAVGSTACTPCTNDTSCPYGSSAELTAAVVAVQAAHVTLGTTLAASTEQATAAANTVPLGGDSAASVSLIVVYAIVLAIVLAVLALLLAFCFARGCRRWIGRTGALFSAPMFVYRVDSATGRLNEDPYNLRGVVALLTIVTVALATAYQVHNFVVNRFANLQSLQAGTEFAVLGTPTSQAPTQVNATVTLFASPIVCSPDAYVISAALVDHVGAGSQQALPPPACTTSLDSGAVTLSFGMPAIGTLPSADAALVLAIVAVNGSLAYAPAMAYTSYSRAFDGTVFAVTETIVAPAGVGSAATILTGVTTASLAAVPTEWVPYSGAITTGFTFSFVGTSVGSAALPTAALSVAFAYSVPAYYMRINQIEQITILMLLSSTLAIAGGILSGGGVIALATTYGTRACRERQARKIATNEAYSTELASYM